MKLPRGLLEYFNEILNEIGVWRVGILFFECWRVIGHYKISLDLSLGFYLLQLLLSACKTD